MIKPNLKQIESAVHSFWFYNQQPKTETEKELFNSFDPKGTRIYRRLLKRDWQDVLESIYPLSQKIIGTEWTDIAARYIKTFPPEHFNLNRLAKKFALYLLEHELQLPAYLSELADYEWLELEVMEHPATVNRARIAAPGTVKDFLELSPVVNPTLSIRSYSFEIQEIVRIIEEDKITPDKKQFLLSFSRPSLIAAFRPPAGHHCEFLELNEVEAESLRAAKINYGELAKLVISRRPDRDAQTISLQFINIVERFHEVGIFIGSETS